MTYLNMQFILLGCNVSFFNLLVTIMINAFEYTDLTYHQKEEKAQRGMIAFGSGELVGALVEGKVIDLLGLKRAAVFNSAMSVIMTVFTLY